LVVRYERGPHPRELVCDVIVNLDLNAHIAFLEGYVDPAEKASI
jgi:hypothetical protein